jgi:hypothetical protein
MVEGLNAMHTNNPRYWFRAKRYGFGWGLPVAWQGWVFFLSWLLITLLGVRLLTPGSQAMRWAFIGAMVFFLLVVCYWKGDPAGRRWNRGDDN